MRPLYLDMIARWKWALFAGAALSVLLSWGILTDPEASFLSRGTSPPGVNELILASLWGSLLISIDLARGTARVWATLPHRTSSLALAVWILGVLTFPLVATFVYTAMAAYAWLDGGELEKVLLAPLALLNTLTYSGLAQLLFCESRTAGLPRWRRDAGRLCYLLLLGGSYFAIGLYPPDWLDLGAVQAALLLAGFAATAASLPRTRRLLASLRAGERISKPAMGKAGSGLGRQLSGLVRGPGSEAALMGLLAALAFLAPVALIVAALRRSPELADRLLSLGGWNHIDLGFSLMICLIFGVVFVGFFAAHPWMNALRALRSLPYGPGRVAWSCLRPALVAILAVLAGISWPMFWLLGPELGPLLWYVALLSPGLAVVGCAGFLRWGYAVVMLAVFGLIPVSLAVRRLDSSLLASPPVPGLAVGGALFLALSYALFVLTIVRSPAAYRHKHVPWF